jgi:hypothetical protein
MSSLTPSIHETRAAERGSAFLFVLFALLVLSILGLSLAMVTQSEVQIGGMQKQATRVFYGADSGLRIQLANHMVNGDVLARTRALGNALVLQSTPVLGVQIQEFVEVSPIYPIFSGTCNLCMLNPDSNYASVNHVVTATGLRVGIPTPGDPGTEQARKTVAQMFALQPWDPTIAAIQQVADLSSIQY